jgi:large subunit ribosomal protein L13
MTAFTAGTYFAKPSEVNKKWYIVDAQDLVLGRLSSEVAKILRGKHKPQFTAHIDCGDNVIIINAEKVHLTGKKLTDKIFFWHSGHPGGIKDRTIKQIMVGGYPERVLEKAIERMMPKESPLARKQLKCLHVYASNTHPHEAQQPITLNIADKNPKNKRKI